MKTSLICLLLLAAVACAAPQAGEMSGEKRVGMAEKMREKMSEEKREEAENAVADAKSDVKARSFDDLCYGSCHPNGMGGYSGCFLESCENTFEYVHWKEDSTGCLCCFQKNSPNSCITLDDLLY